MTTQTRTRTLLATAALAAVLVTGACASGSDGQDAGTSTAEPALGRSDSAAGDSLDTAADHAVDGSAEAQDADRASGSGKSSAAADPKERTVIATGTISLEAEDVADARAGVQRVLDVHQGAISHEETSTDDDGELERARMVLRIPIENLEQAKADLAEVAVLTSSNYGEENVKTQVLDVEARIRAQETSVRRIETLLAEAEDLRTLLSIEQELTRRQAELDSLKSQQEWLADQTELATITVHLERAAETEEDDTDRAGFLGGLVDGWDTFVAALSGTAAVVGFLLPWLGLLLLLGAVARLAWRRTRRTA